MDVESARPTALVVEDDNLIRMETIDVLEDAGFDVVEAWTGAMAVRMLEQLPDIRLVFTDIVMPGPVSGLDLARLMAQRWPDTAVMICSGPVIVAPRDLPNKARFFSKPFHAQEVSDAARGLIAA